jgi:hypothetical protein
MDTSIYETPPPNNRRRRDTDQAISSDATTIRPSLETIRERAYELYMERGGAPGSELDDWLRMELELTLMPES